MGWFSKLFKKPTTQQPPNKQAELQVQDIPLTPVNVPTPKALTTVTACPCTYKDALHNGYIVLDCETTGLSPSTDAIIEIAALKFDASGNELDSFSSFVNPNRPIPSKITQITGITDSMVIDAPCISEISEILHCFLGEYPIIAHNAPFDIGFLKAAYQSSGICASLKYIDTVKLAKQAFPGMPNYKLSTLCRCLGISMSQDHRALSDVRLTQSLFQLCVSQIKAPKNCTDYLHCAADDLSDEAFNKGYRYWERGEKARMDGDFEVAIELFDKARDIGYTYPAVYESYAKAYRKLKDYNKEIAILDEAIKACPRNHAETFAIRKQRAQELMAAQEAREAEVIRKELEKAQKAELKRKAKEEKESKPKAPCGRAIIQLTDDGVVIKQHESVASAAQAVGVTPKCIRDAAQGRQKHAGGFCWKYADTVCCENNRDSSND